MKEHHIPSNSVYKKTYLKHYQISVEWLIESFSGSRGSSAFYLPIKGWSDPYPETTGYIIPTLLEAGKRLGLERATSQAVAAGEWILSIQQEDGYWFGGTYPPKNDRSPSIFNTGQILKGLCALYEFDQDDKWLEAANRGAEWLARHVAGDGIWTVGHYRGGFQPTYYTRVAWPMLEVWGLNNNTFVRDAALRVLDWVLTMQNDNGTFRNWGFDPSKPAFTHTIAYTLRGLIESSRIFNDWTKYGALTEKPLDHLLRRAELKNGALAGTFDEEWKADDSFVCLTGCAQTALCLMKLHGQHPDLRLVNAAAKLVDYVCKNQVTRGPKSIKGAVAGSKPLWGKYMRYRYPNWAAKFHADALLELSDILSEASQTA